MTPQEMERLYRQPSARPRRVVIDGRWTAGEWLLVATLVIATIGWCYLLADLVGLL